MEALLAAATPPPGPAPYRGLPPEEIIESVRRVVAQPWLMRDRRCLRASLLAFRFLRLAGFPAVIHFAISPPAPDLLRAHSWVTLNGTCLLDPPEPGMVGLFAWDGELLAPADG